MVQLLLQHKEKFDIDQCLNDETKSTAAGIAVEKGNVSIIKLLAEAKADLEKPRPTDGTTPLHRAVLNGDYSTVAFLIDRYKNIFVKHTSGQSPFLFACAMGRWDLAKLFLNKVKYKKVPVPKEDMEIMEKCRHALELSIGSKPNHLLSSLGLYSSSLSNSEQPHDKREPSSPSPR